MWLVRESNLDDVDMVGTADDADVRSTAWCHSTSVGDGTWWSAITAAAATVTPLGSVLLTMNCCIVYMGSQPWEFSSSQKFYGFSGNWDDRLTAPNCWNIDFIEFSWNNSTTSWNISALISYGTQRTLRYQTTVYDRLTAFDPGQPG